MHPQLEVFDEFARGLGRDAARCDVRLVLGARFTEGARPRAAQPCIARRGVEAGIGREGRAA